MIEHLVLSGGGNCGFAFFGAIKYFVETQFLDMEKIKTIHATSIGTFIAVGLALSYPLQDLEKFYMDRPWHKIFNVTLTTILQGISEGGLFQKDQIIQSFRPILLAKDLSIDITLEDFFQATQKELHFYTTDFEKLEIHDLSYLTHPQWTLIEAVYASCCLPILFKPYEHLGKYYIDGAVLMNYPLVKCLEYNVDPNTILGMYHTGKIEQDKESPFESSSSYKLIDYLFSLVYKIWKQLKKHRLKEFPPVVYQIPIEVPVNASALLYSIESKEERLRLMNIGYSTAQTVSKTFYTAISSTNVCNE